MVSDLQQPMAIRQYPDLDAMESYMGPLKFRLVPFNVLPPP